MSRLVTYSSRSEALRQRHRYQRHHCNRYFVLPPPRSRCQQNAPRAPPVPRHSHCRRNRHRCSQRHSLRHLRLPQQPQLRASLSALSLPRPPRGPRVCRGCHRAARYRGHRQHDRPLGASARACHRACAPCGQRSPSHRRRLRRRRCHATSGASRGQKRAHRGAESEKLRLALRAARRCATCAMGLDHHILRGSRAHALRTREALPALPPLPPAALATGDRLGPAVAACPAVADAGSPRLDATWCA